MSGTNEVVVLTEEENANIGGWSSVFMLSVWALAAFAVLAFVALALVGGPAGWWKIKTALSPFVGVFGIGAALSFFRRRHLICLALKARETEQTEQEKLLWQNQHPD